MTTDSIIRSILPQPWIFGYIYMTRHNISSCGPGLISNQRTGFCYCCCCCCSMTVLFILHHWAHLAWQIITCIIHLCVTTEFILFLSAHIPSLLEGNFSVHLRLISLWHTAETFDIISKRNLSCSHSGQPKTMILAFVVLESTKTSFLKKEY